MSLCNEITEANLVIVEREIGRHHVETISGGLSLTEWADLNVLMDAARDEERERQERMRREEEAERDAARAEGVAALQQAGEPVAWRYRDAWGNWAYCQALDNSIGPSVNTEKQPLYASPLPQQTALVEEKGLGPHEPAACGEGTLPSPSEPPRSAGYQAFRDALTMADNQLGTLRQALDLPRSGGGEG